jgi:hypothetical protein
LTFQEPNPRKDEEYWQKIVEVVKDPPSKGRNGGGSGIALSDLPGLEMSNLRDSELQTLLSHMSQQQLLHLFGKEQIVLDCHELFSVTTTKFGLTDSFDHFSVN